MDKKKNVGHAILQKEHFTTCGGHSKISYWMEIDHNIQKILKCFYVKK